MIFFLDTEFNGFDGELISISFVSREEDYPPFYEALECAMPTEWVRDNVMPVLQTKPITRGNLIGQMSQYFSGLAEITVIADWPEDIAHAASLMAYEGNRKIDAQNIRFELINVSDFDCPSVSEVPHNAYYDALALRNYYVQNIERLT